MSAQPVLSSTRPATKRPSQGASLPTPGLTPHPARSPTTPTMQQDPAASGWKKKTTARRTSQPQSQTPNVDDLLQPVEESDEESGAGALTPIAMSARQLVGNNASSTRTSGPLTQSSASFLNRVQTTASNDRGKGKGKTAADKATGKGKTGKGKAANKDKTVKGKGTAKDKTAAKAKSGKTASQVTPRSTASIQRKGRQATLADADLSPEPPAPAIAETQPEVRYPSQLD